MSTNEISSNMNNPFYGKRVLIMGYYVNHSRKSMQRRLLALGARLQDKLGHNTDYVIAGEKCGVRLPRAKELGITILTEDEFEEMLKE